MSRHSFEPSRLLLGLAMLGAAAAYLMDASGAWHVPFWALLIIVPAALVLAGLTAILTLLARRALARRRAVDPAARTRARD